MAIELPSAQYLNECLTYDPLTGKLFWKHRPLHHFRSWRGQEHFARLFSGKEAGHEAYTETGEPRGIVISLKTHPNGRNKLIASHRIIFSLMGVPIPTNLEVDHQDRNPYNNRWDNLRLATSSQNAANRRNRRNRKDPSLPKGVSKNKNGFRARIDEITIGTFKTPGEAHVAYCIEADKMYGEFARFN